MDLSPTLMHENFLQDFFGNCVTLGQDRKVPLDSFFPVPVLFALATTLAFLSLVHGPVTRATSGSKTVKYFFLLLATALSAAQIVSEAVTLARNVGTFDVNMGQGAQFVSCALEAFDVVDLSAIDTYLLVLEIIRHSVSIMSSVLFLVVLWTLDFRYDNTALAPRIAMRIALFYLAAFALSALLLIPGKPAAHGCTFNTDVGAYVCRADYWKKYIDNPFFSLSAQCDSATADVIQSGAARSCTWRPFGKLFHTFSERLLQFMISAHVLAAKSATVGLIGVLALVTQVLYFIVSLVSRRMVPPPRWLGITVLVFVALHVGGWLFLDIAIVDMFRLAKGSIACGCTGDPDSVVRPTGAALVSAASLLDGLKLVFAFARVKQVTHASEETKLFVPRR